MEPGPEPEPRAITRQLTAWRHQSPKFSNLTLKLETDLPSNLPIPHQTRYSHSNGAPAHTTRSGSAAPIETPLITNMGVSAAAASARLDRRAAGPPTRDSTAAGPPARDSESTAAGHRRRV